jgi:hypothetical protein
MPSDVLITPASSKIDFTDGSNATKRLNISGTAFSFNSNLNVLSSTSLGSAFKAEGVNGTLFEVVDDLSNSLMSVNTIGGLPVFEVFANNSIIAGQYNANDFVILGNKVGIGIASPSAKLHVVGSSVLANATTINPDSYLGSIVAGNIADGSGWGVTGIAGNGSAAGRTFAMGNSGTDFYMATSNGSSATSLQTFLQVSGPARHVFLTPVSGNVNIGGSSVPNNKLSVLGSASIGSGYNIAAPTNGLIVQGNVGIGTTTPNAKIESYFSSNALTFNYLATNINVNSPIPIYAFGVTGPAETVSIKAGIGYERHLTNGRGAMHFYNDSVNDTSNITGSRSSIGDIKMTIQNDGNVGIGIITPSYKLDVNGTTRFGGIVYNEAVQTDDFNYFNLQPYIESETLSSILSISGTAPTFTTLTNTTAPFSKVLSVSAYGEALMSDYIPVQAGEIIYGEIWAYRATGAAGIAGVLYCGVQRYDKDKKMIDSNGGLNTAPSGYFIASNQTIPSNSTWTKYSGTLVLPTSHTVYNTSDGGPVRYIRPYIIYNYTAGTILTYIGGWKIRKVQLTRDSGPVAINGSVAIGSNSVNYGRLQISATTTSPSLSATNPTDPSLIISNSDVAYGTMFATYGDGKGALQQRRTDTATYYDFSLQPHGGNVGIGVASPRVLLDLARSNNVGQVLLIGETGANIRVGFGLAPSNAGMRIFSLNHISDGLIEFGGISSSDGSTWTRNHRLGLAGGNSFFNEQGGNVGIGTVTPSAKLSTGATSGMKLLVYDNSSTGVYTGLGQDLAAGNSTDLFAHSLSNLGFITFGKIGTNGSTYTEWARFNTSGNLGIGTTTPAQKLELYGVVGDPYTGGVNQTGIMRFSNTTDNGIFDFGIRAGGTGAWLQSTDKTNLSVNYPLLLNPNGGNVSVGALTSNNKLHVNGSVSIGSNYNTAATTNGLIVEGNVGVGITAPTAKLDVTGSNTNGYSLLLRSGDNYNGTDSVQIAFGFANQTNYRHSIRTRHNPLAPISGVVGNNIDFYVWKRGTDIAADLGSQFVMTMQGDGNVGIGITNPAVKLHVNSTVAGDTLVRADGTNGTLFSVVDDLSDSLMSVNNSAGLPVLEVFADDRIVAGQYGQNDLVVINNKVGIGTNSPAYKLDVRGSTVNARVGVMEFGTWPLGVTYVYLQNNTLPLISGNYALLQGPTGETFLNAASGQVLHFRTNNTERWAITAAGILESDGLQTIRTSTGTLTLATNGANGHIILSPNGTGNVGIGTNSPAALLQIGTGTPTAATGGIQFGGDTGTRLYRSASGIITCSGTIAATFSGNLTGNVTGNVSGTAGGETFATVTGRGASTTTQISVGTTSSGSMYTGIKSGAGYSDTVSGATFKSITDHPTGGSFAFAAYYNGAPGTGTNSFYVAANGGAYFAQGVGIGVASPLQALHINGNIILDGTTNGYTQSASRAIGYGSNNGAVLVDGFSGMEIQSVNAPVPNGGNYSQNLRFWTHHYGTGTGNTPRMILQYDGNVGIGTTSPSQKLQVNGTVLATAFSGPLTGNVTGNVSGSSGSCTGNAATATKLFAGVNINGTSFDGSAAITTTNWGANRSITIGVTPKNVNGGADVSWTVAEVVGYTPAYGTAAFQSKSLDTVSTPGLYQYDGAFGGTKPPDNGANYRTVEIGSSSRFSQIAMSWNSDGYYFRRHDGTSFSTWRTVIHDGNYTSYPDATKLPLTGGTLTGTLTATVIKGDAGADYPHSFTNTDSGNTHWTNRSGRLLTSNGTGWQTDGRDPIMALVTSGNSNSLNIANSIGLALHNESQTNNTFSPAIAFSNRSNSGSYNTTYAAIIGRKTGQGVDSNWSAGELHFYTMPVGAYENNIPSLIIDSAANVGIGVIAPTAKLNILSSNSLSSVLKTEGVNGTLFEVTDDLSNSLMSVNTIGGLPVFEVFANNSIVAGQYGQNDFVISGNKIGIGTASPLTKLHIYENASRVTYIAQNSLHTARFEAFGTATAIDTTASNGIFFRINSSNIVKFAADGNVGIGISTPANKLHVLTTGGTVNAPNVVATFQANTATTIIAGGGTAIKFVGVSSGGNLQDYDQCMISSLGYADNNRHGMQFWVKPNASTVLTAALTINNDSSVVANSSITATSFSGPLTGSVTGTATNATQLGGVAASSYVRNDVDGTDSTALFRLKTVTKSLTVTAAWTDTGISGGSDLESGAYILTLNVDNYAAPASGGQYNETYTGIMYWYAGATNSADYDEIPLHKSGHAPNGRYINLRTLRGVSGVLKLQITCNLATGGASNYIFKFRRMI